jgi:hypothetical protein
MKLTMIHHLHTATSDNRPCVFDSITVRINDKPVLIGNEPKVFHSTLDVYKWLLGKQGVDVEEINTRA